MPSPSEFPEGRGPGGKTWARSDFAPPSLGAAMSFVPLVAEEWEALASNEGKEDILGSCVTPLANNVTHTCRAVTCEEVGVCEDCITIPGPPTERDMRNVGCGLVRRVTLPVPTANGVAGGVTLGGCPGQSPLTKLVLDLTSRCWSLCSCTLCAPANGRGLNLAPPCCDMQKGGDGGSGVSAILSLAFAI